MSTNGNKLTPISFNNQQNKKITTPIFNQQNEDEDDIYSKDLIITGSLDSLAKSWSIETGECVPENPSFIDPRHPRRRLIVCGPPEGSLHP